jgi:NAD+ synthase (glutamine-hydrolysing)
LAAIRDKQTPLECKRRCACDAGDSTSPSSRRGSSGSSRLWCRNHWERERYAPSSPGREIQDPRGWCRFPTLTSVFEVELADLRRAGMGGEG